MLVILHRFLPHKHPTKAIYLKVTSTACPIINMTLINSNLLPLTILALLVAVHGAPLANITSNDINTTMQDGSITRSVEVITYHPTAAAAGPLVPRLRLPHISRPKKPTNPSTMAPQTTTRTSTRVPTTTTSARVPTKTSTKVPTTTSARTPTTPRTSTRSHSRTTPTRTTSQSPTATRTPVWATPTFSLGKYCHFSFYF